MTWPTHQPQRRYALLSVRKISTGAEMLQDRKEKGRTSSISMVFSRPPTADCRGLNATEASTTFWRTDMRHEGRGVVMRPLMVLRNENGGPEGTGVDTVSNQRERREHRQPMGVGTVAVDPIGLGTTSAKHAKCDIAMYRRRGCARDVTGSLPTPLGTRCTHPKFGGSTLPRHVRRDAR